MPVIFHVWCVGNNLTVRDGGRYREYGGHGPPDPLASAEAAQRDSESECLIKGNTVREETAGVPSD